MFLAPILSQVNAKNCSSSTRRVQCSHQYRYYCIAAVPICYFSCTCGFFLFLHFFCNLACVCFKLSSFTSLSIARPPVSLSLTTSAAQPSPSSSPLESPPPKGKSRDGGSGVFCAVRGGILARGDACSPQRVLVWSWCRWASPKSHPSGCGLL